MNMVDFEALDFDDPCAVLTAIRPAYYRLVAGQGAQSASFTAGNGTTEMVSFQKTDLGRLSTLVANLETACRRSKGERSRFAVRAGGRIS